MLKTSEMIKEIEKMRDEIKKEINETNLKRDVMNSIYKKEYRKEIMSELKKEQLPKPKSYYFITINPKECSVLVLDRIMYNIRKKKWIKVKNYCYEQRGETDDERGIGKHIHMMIEKNRPRSRVLTEIHNTVKEYCGKEKIDIVLVNSDSEERYINYMNGNKSAEKQNKVKQDKLWRSEWLIRPIYECV